MAAKIYPGPVKKLIGRFFVVGETPTTEAGRKLREEIFTAGGQIIVNKKAITGTAELSSHWISGLQARKHVVYKVYSSNDAGDDLMLIGNVTWIFNEGSKDSDGFAAKALVEKGGSGEPKLKLIKDGPLGLDGGYESTEVRIYSNAALRMGSNSKQFWGQIVKDVVAGEESAFRTK